MQSLRGTPTNPHILVGPMEAQVEGSNECIEFADRKYPMNKIPTQRDYAKKMCRVGLLLSPVLIGLPLAYFECRRMTHLVHKQHAQNMKWNKAYEKCMKRSKSAENGSF